MKKSLFLYLFILTALMAVFTYMFLSKEVVYEQQRFDKMNKRLSDSISLMKTKYVDANYFSLENDQNAQNYFDNTANNGKFLSYDKIIPKVTGNLMDLNANPKGNPYIDQVQIGSQKFIINKVKVINHRWLIADYTDGEYWGEVLLKYFINEDETVSYEIIQSVLYQKQ